MTDSDEDHDGERASDESHDAERVSDEDHDGERVSDESNDAERVPHEDGESEPAFDEDHDVAQEVEVSFGPDGTPDVGTSGDGDDTAPSTTGSDASSGDASADSAADEQVVEGDGSPTATMGDGPAAGDDPDSVDGGGADDTTRDDPNRGPFVEDLAAEVREEYDTAPDEGADDPPDIFADRRSTPGERAGGDTEMPDDDPATSDETNSDQFAEQSGDGALADEPEEAGKRRAPLSELADEVRRDAEAVDPDDDPLFEPAGTDDAGPSGWDRLDEESEEFTRPDAEPTAEAVDEAGQEHVVDKRQYCQQCPHLADPPELDCTHEGTEIVEVTDAEHFRVRACPVIGEDGPNFDAVADTDDGG